MMNIYEFKDEEFIADRIHKYKPNKAANIIIDNGSHSCRAGWSNNDKPKLIFRNLIAKYRGKKENETKANFYFGNNIKELENPKWNIRTQFDMDVASHFDVQECSFDYIFKYLGINTEDAVNHNVCITEAVCIPNQLRQHMSELLFECYNVPNVIYGVDKLFSWYRNMKHKQYGMIVSCGYHTSHVLPIVKGAFDAKNSRRLNLGGFHLMVYLRQLLQLRFPLQTSFFNLSRAQELLKTQTYIPQNVFEELEKWKLSDYQKSKEVRLKVPIMNNISEKDIEMRKSQAKRLKEINQKKREEKLKQDNEKLEKLQNLLESDSVSNASYRSKLKELGFKNENELKESIKALQKKIEERKEKCDMFYKEMDDWDNIDVTQNSTLSFDQVEISIGNLEDEQIELLDKCRARKSKKTALTKRKSYASKERMRILNQLAKSANNTNANKSSKAQDTFGMKDSDWEVYKYINKDESDSDEEQDQERLNEIEQSLSQLQLLRNQIMVKLGQAYDYLPLTTERVLVPEMLYQPSITGNDQEGITGMIQYVLKNYESETQNEMIKNILITGGPTQISGFKERLEAEIMSILPFQSTFKVNKSNNCLLDSWLGARDFVNSIGTDINKFSISRHDYDEYGLGYLQEHQCSNIYVPINF